MQAHSPVASPVGSPVGWQHAGRSAVLLLVLALPVLPGCTSGGRSEDATAAATTTAATATTVTAPTTTTAGPQSAVLTAYRAFWADVVAAGKTADWRSPRLAAHATGQALAEVRATYRALSARGLVARGTVDLRPTVLSVNGAKATLYDCNSTAAFLAYDAKTGALRDRSSGQRNGKTVTLTRQDGTWKVAKATTEAGRCTK